MEETNVRFLHNERSFIEEVLKHINQPFNPQIKIDYKKSVSNIFMYQRLSYCIYFFS